MIHAVAHLRAMRGGAQSHLIQADDGHHYVVKLLNNPQHPRILANEWLGTKIAQAIGLSVPAVEVMEISSDFIAATPDLVLRYGNKELPPYNGPAFASRIPVGDPSIPIYDYLPEVGLELVQNLHEFAGILALDKWLCNCDGRQVIFCRPKPRSRLRVFFIDFGFCFDAGDWTFPDGPFHGTYPRSAAYRSVTGWASFEPWLSNIESFPEGTLLKIALEMPQDWAPDRDRLLALLDQIIARRTRVRSLIESFRFSSRAPFAHWPASPLAVSA